MSYRIREVDTDDEDIADTIKELHTLTFVDNEPIPDVETGHWWLAYLDREPVGFASVMQSTYVKRAGYFSRVGILPGHRGHGLQKRLMRALEARSWRNGWERVVSDTTDNVPSANNFIRCGYQMFIPQYPWSLPRAVFWTKAR
jgi:GNAT superfamily N-acetyltransferase